MNELLGLTKAETLSGIILIRMPKDKCKCIDDFACQVAREIIKIVESKFKNEKSKNEVPKCKNCEIKV